MTARRWALAAGAAVLALGGGSAALVAWLAAPPPNPQPDATSPEPAPPPALPPADAPLLPLPAPPPTARKPRPAPPPREVSLELPPPRPPAEPERRDWEEITPLPRVPPAVERRITSLRPSIARCYDDDVQASYGGRPFSAVGHPAPGSGGVVLVLHVETDASGRTRIVDAPVEARGSAQDGLLACVQEALRQAPLEGGAGKPGARVRIRYPLHQPLTAGQGVRRAQRVRLKPH